MTQTQLEERLQATVDLHYHHRHPFNVRMHEGKLSHSEVERWIKNRYHYQRAIPVKDSLILAKLPTRDERRLWLTRIIDHDGRTGTEGGLEAWLQLGDAAGIPRVVMLDEREVVAGVRFAVEAYVDFCRLRSWQEAVAASLTELLAPDLMERRIEAFERHYRWVDPCGLEYFRRRVIQGRRDASHALALVLDAATTPEMQSAVVAAVELKCEVLWAMLDAIEHGKGACGV
jgi:pyrroloquinoline-quinone synthase